MKPSGALAQEYLDELISKEREIEKETDKQKREAKRSKDRVKSLKQRTSELLDLLEGREHAQPPLPLTTKGPEKNAKKEPVPPLKWDQVGLFLVALTAVGSFRIEPKERAPGYIVNFVAGDGRSKKLGEAPTEEKAKEIASATWAGDGFLKNAGHGKLAIVPDKKKGKPGDDAIDVTPKKALPPKREKGE